MVSGGMEMQYLDIIGIGAINYDYIFFCPKLEYKNRMLPEFGQEYLNISREAIYEDINKLMYTTEHTNQVCGSAFFALKTIHAISPELKLSYVGVCGKPTKKELDAGFRSDVHEEFSFLSNTDWLFYDEGEPGLSLVRIVKGTRNWIDIDPGVNSKLEEYILKKEKQDGDNSFVEYLSKSKWIHISSLSDFRQFEFIVKRVVEAKKLNPLLKISVDPGYEYTKKYKLELREIFSVADYVFLNKNEVENLIGDTSLTEKNKYNVLASVFNYYKLSNTQVIIIKGKSKHTLASFKEGELVVSNFWHKKLRNQKIQNDTGAGDAFAGGFLASMLSTRLLVHQPEPIKIGAIAALGRMKSREDPFPTIADDTQKYMDMVNRVETNNVKQRLEMVIHNIKTQLSTFLMGIVTGIIASLIVWWIQLLCK